MDLITPVKTWLRGLSKDELIAMLESGRDGCGEFYHVELEGCEYSCPRAWAVQEHERRMGDEKRTTEFECYVMDGFMAYFEKHIKPEHKRKKNG